MYFVILITNDNKKRTSLNNSLNILCAIHIIFIFFIFNIIQYVKIMRFAGFLRVQIHSWNANHVS